ncbi:hypothetical protein X798_05538 [Onchocerca flexuosa]|uniref:Uncharacterized protein n=2 Tax=Onchocerca flexuosa TaxID=387005 RepID=A0A183GYZ0_9BILA|nr:hypothetical protein X798_05538 [Onchocerca flexuosa]VDO25841.1 unnamed protein product [Onchocerca flexuosa]
MVLQHKKCSSYPQNNSTYHLQLNGGNTTCWFSGSGAARQQGIIVFAPHKIFLNKAGRPPLLTSAAILFPQRPNL